MADIVETDNDSSDNRKIEVHVLTKYILDVKLEKQVPTNIHDHQVNKTPHSTEAPEEDLSCFDDTSSDYEPFLGFDMNAASNPDPVPTPEVATLKRRQRRPKNALAGKPARLRKHHVTAEKNVDDPYIACAAGIPVKSAGFGLERNQ